MSEQQLKAWERLRTKVADGRARENDFVHMDNLLKQYVGKSGKSKESREAEEKRVAIETATDKVKTEAEKVWLDAQKTEIDILDDRIKEYNDANNTEKKKLMNPEQYRELLDRRGQLTGGIQNFNKGGAIPQQAQTPTQQVQTFDSVQEAEAAGLPVGSPVMIGGRPAVIR